MHVVLSCKLDFDPLYKIKLQMGVGYSLKVYYFTTIGGPNVRTCFLVNTLQIAIDRLIDRQINRYTCLPPMEGSLAQM